MAEITTRRTPRRGVRPKASVDRDVVVHRLHALYAAGERGGTRRFVGGLRGAGEFDRGPNSRIRRERIEALGDSNPPHMAEAIGRAIVAASTLSSQEGKTT